MAERRFWLGDPGTLFFFLPWIGFACRADPRVEPISGCGIGPRLVLYIRAVLIVSFSPFVPPPCCMRAQEADIFAELDTVIDEDERRTREREEAIAAAKK